MDKPLLHCVHLSKVFDKANSIISVLHDINLTVKLGEIVCIQGSSGAGKSILLSLLGGMDRPTSGTICFENILFNSLSLAELAKLRQNKIGMIFQNFNLVSYWTAVENVEAALVHQKISSRQKRKTAQDMLARLGLSHRLKNYPRELSMGEQQRVAIARTLIKNVKLIIADEPTGEVDQKTSGLIMDLLLQDVRDRKTTLVVATHGHFQAHVAHRTFYLQEGRLLESKA